MVAALVLVALPALAVLAGGEEDDIPLIVQVVEAVPRLTADAIHISLPLEREEVLLIPRELIRLQEPLVASFLRVTLVEQWKGDVEPLPEVLNGYARFGKDRLPKIEPQVLEIVWKCAGVEVKDYVVLPVVPEGQTLHPIWHVPHILLAQGVSVQGIEAQHKHTSLAGVGRVVTRLTYSVQHLCIARTGRRIVIYGIHVHPEPPLTQGEIEAGLHTAVSVVPSADPEPPIAGPPEPWAGGDVLVLEQIGGVGVAGEVVLPSALPPRLEVVVAEVTEEEEGAAAEEEEVALLGLHGDRMTEAQTVTLRQSGYELQGSFHTLSTVPSGFLTTILTEWLTD